MLILKVALEWQVRFIHMEWQSKVYTQLSFGAKRFLLGTFANLAAPELAWEQMPSAPAPCLDDDYFAQKNPLYVFVGYGNLDHVYFFFSILSTFSCLQNLQQCRLLMIVVEARVE